MRPDSAPPRAAQQPRAAQELDSLLAQAMAALSRGAGAEGLAFARLAVERAPHAAVAHFALGRAHKAQGALEPAVAAYRQALALRPDFAEVLVSLGIALKAQGDLDGAIACYERAIQIAPQLAAAHTNLGVALTLRAPQRASVQGQPDEAAIAVQQRAAALSPQDASVHRNLGVTLLNAGRPAEAMHAFNTVLTLDPRDAAACLSLVRCLVALGDFGLARVACDTWLARNGEHAAVLHAQANALTMLGEVDAALHAARRSLALADAPAAAMQLGQALLQSRQLEEGLATCRRAIERSGRDVRLYPVWLLSLNYWHEDPAPVLAAHAELAPLLQALAPAASAPPRAPARAGGAKLRVGLVSGDFVRHSVAFFVEPLLACLSQDRFELSCYHNNARSDAVTARLKSHGHRWVDCAHLSDEALAQRVRDDGIDLLLDLTGMTANTRMLMFARQPAPVQLGYLGYPTVTGVPTLQWRITDRDIDPGDLPELASDRPLALPRSMFCYRPPDEAPEPAPPPCLGGEPLTFGSFNNMAKLSNRTLALWARVLRAVPGSRLLLKSASAAQAGTRADVQAFMATQGIAAERLLFSPRVISDAEHLALYHRVDIALDSFPYNGATTTCEALWMGVPVLSLRGHTHTSRMGASILRAAGHPEWVLDSDDAFVAAAAQMAAEPAALGHLRCSLRTTLRRSELLDGPGMAKAFGALLEQAWHGHLASQTGAA